MDEQYFKPLLTKAEIGLLLYCLRTQRNITQKQVDRLKKKLASMHNSTIKL